MFFQLSVARRPATLLAGLCFATLMFSGCGVGKSLDDVIARIESAQQTIAAESGAWRSELDKLSKDLKSLEGQVASDVRGVVTHTTNQVDALVTDSVAMTDQAVESRIAQAGTEARCDFNFVKRSASDQLRYLAADLKFWQKNHKHLAPPSHGTCWIDPGAVSMYETDAGRWVADTITMEAKQPIINVYGYNFSSDRLPVVDLRNPDGSIVQPAVIKATYRTNYLISLDLSAGLATMPANLTLVLNWPDDPDHADASTISLLRTSEAKLELRSPVFTPANPTAAKDPVILKVTVANTGGRPSGVAGFDVHWVPEPGAVNPPELHHPSLAPGTSDTISFPAYTFQNSGDLFTNVYIAGGPSEMYKINVAQPPHVPAAERDYGNFPDKDSRTGNSFGGFGQDVVYGGPCASGYVKSNAWLDVTQVTHDQHQNYATAALTWANDDPHDCSVRVHYSIQATGDPFRQNSISVVIFIKERGI